MWMILGTAAIVSAILNTCFTLRHRDAKWFRFISLSLTALTLCAWYSLDALGQGERLGCVRRYVPGDGEGFLDADDRFDPDQQCFFIHEKEISIQERENANPQS